MPLLHWLAAHPLAAALFAIAIMTPLTLFIIDDLTGGDWIMRLLGLLGVIAVIVGAYWWLALPRLRRLPWWDSLVGEFQRTLASVYARLRGLCGNSRTIAVAYAAELLGVLDEAKVLDWSQLLGSEAAGRVMVIMGAVMILLRLVTRTAVSFKAEA